MSGRSAAAALKVSEHLRRKREAERKSAVGSSGQRARVKRPASAIEAASEASEGSATSEACASSASAAWPSEEQDEKKPRPNPQRPRNVRAASAASGYANIDLQLRDVRRGTTEDFRRGLLSWDMMAELQAESTGMRQSFEASNPLDFLNITVPDRFHGFEQYLSVWTPLAIREMRAQLLNQVLTEPPDNGIPVLVSVSAGRAESDRFVSLDVKIDANGNVKSGNGRSWRGEVVLLLVERNALSQVLRLQPEQGAVEGGRGGVASGTGALPRRQNVTANPFVADRRFRGMLGICTSSGRGAEGFRIAVHQQRLNATLTAEGPPADSDGVKALFMHPLGPVVSALREWEALNSLDKIPLVREILEGREMTENSDQADCTKLCDETLGSTFSGWMRSKFNPSQQDAIAAAASSEGFTLIKGPPGTGKTTTLTALLNAIHLREFNWYYEQLLGLSRLEEGANIDAAWRRIRAQKPHILVCAPSNIAVDNIVQRIIEEGFMDGNGSNYKPDIVRVGRRTGLDAGIVSLEEKVSQITGKSKSWQRNRLNELEDILKAITLTTFDVMGRLRVMVRAMEEGPLPPYWELRLDEGAKPYYVNHWAQSTQCLRPDAPVEGTEGVGLQQMPEWQALAARLTQSMEDFEKCMDEKKKTRFALDYADYQNPNAGDVRNHLEAAILDTAHIVFTTLNSSGQGCMSHCRKFQVVVVDEAAQSVELSTLIPLRLGSKQCVLVGDPQQLSATVFAQNGSATQFDRSLFQRLEHRGHKVHLLNTQYRMHPKISAFPRAAFYDSKLLDGPNVLQLTYSHSFHKHRVFRPFVFLNLTTGVSSSSSKSLCNPAEARLAVNFFTTLMYTTNNEMAGRVGVITPYSQQLRELSRQFSDTLGASWRDKVEVSTVDGFQGREKDVIIVSLVRAQDKGVGFLADVRRMCVSLTRGKYLLCVIGHETTLRVNPLWQQLMHQAKEANVFISIQNPETDLLSLDDEKKAGSCK